MTSLERLVICLVLSGLAIVGAYAWHLEKVSDAEDAALKKGRAEVQAVLDAERLTAAELARVEKAQQREKLEEVVNEANRKTVLAQADADALRASGRRMQQRIDALAAQARAGQAAAPAEGGTAADSPIDLLADLCKGADERAGVLAEYADAARIAGEACEHSYGGLGPSPDQELAAPQGGVRE